MEFVILYQRLENRDFNAGHSSVSRLRLSVPSLYRLKSKDYITTELKMLNLLNNSRLVPFPLELFHILVSMA